MNLKWILGISAIMTFIVAIGLVFWMKARVAAIKKKYEDFDKKNEEDLGDYKPKEVKAPSNLTETDYSETMITFIVNTIGRNYYKTFWIDEHSGNMQSVGEIIKHTGARKSKMKCDLYIHEYKDNEDIVDLYKDAVKKIKSKGMMFILDLPKKRFNEIRVQEYLEEKTTTFEYQKIEKGVLIIAK